MNRFENLDPRNMFRSVPLPLCGEGLGVGGSRVRYGCDQHDMSAAIFSIELLQSAKLYTPPLTPPLRGGEFLCKHRGERSNAR
jgi:hypothetical protein